MLLLLCVLPPLLVFPSWSFLLTVLAPCPPQTFFTTVIDDIRESRAGNAPMPTLTLPSASLLLPAQGSDPSLTQPRKPRGSTTKVVPWSHDVEPVHVNVKYLPQPLRRRGSTEFVPIPSDVRPVITAAAIAQHVFRMTVPEPDDVRPSVAHVLTGQHCIRRLLEDATAVRTPPFLHCLRHHHRHRHHHHAHISSDFDGVPRTTGLCQCAVTSDA